MSTIYSLNPISAIQRLIPLPGIMETAAGKLDVLLRRLSEAERRAKLLKLEVKNIREEISTLQNSIQKERTKDSALSVNIVNGAASRASVIFIDCLPSTSRSGSGVIDASAPSASKKSKASFNMEGDYVTVYTDGACENNGKPNAKAGIGVWFGDNHPLNVSKPVDGKATNNTAEIQACIQALQQLKDQGIKKVKILTDSQFTINCITKWMKNWKKNSWKTTSGGPVKNKVELQKLDEMLKSFSDVQWVHVAGHNGIRGNEEADKLAREGAQSYQPS